MSNVSFARVLIAQVHKDQLPALVADSVRDAAIAYATNGGAKNLINSVVNACQTTATGKARTPAAGTGPALVLGAMAWILAEAEAIGARPKMAPDNDTRQARAQAFGEAIATRFTEARDAADATRKAAREAAKAAKGEPSPAIDTSEEKETTGAGAGAEGKALAPVAMVDKVADLLASLSDEQVGDLIATHAKVTGRIVAVSAMVDAMASLKGKATAPTKRKARTAEEAPATV